MSDQNELRSVLARYRGPLLEATIDLEQRLYHLLVVTGPSRAPLSPECEEESVYTLFTLAQVPHAGMPSVSHSSLQDDQPVWRVSEAKESPAWPPV